MSRWTLLFCIVALASASVFFSLGVWQLDRLQERQTSNATIAHQRLNHVVPVRELPRDTGQAHYRGVVADGRFDYEHELVFANRTRRGSPGVELLTPVRIAGTDTAVLVNRGWVYSPDGGSVDRTRWREGDSAHVSGYVELFTTEPMPAPSADPRIMRRMNRAAIQARVPYPLAPFYLVLVGDTTDLTHPARRDLPQLGEGSHRSYALQWFSFAVIAIVGAGIAVRRDRQSRTSGIA